MDGWLTVKEFAKRINRSIQRVYYLLDVSDPRLTTQKVGHLNLIHEESAKNFPPKAKLSPARRKASRDGQVKSRKLRAKS